MDTGKFIGLLVFAIIGGLLIMAFTPMIVNVTSADDTFTNDGIVRMTKYDTDAEINAFWDHTAPNQITVNDEVVKLPKFVTSGVEISLTVSGAADFLLRYVSATATNQTLTYSDALGNTSAGVNSNSDATITVSGGTITFSNGTTTKTGTYDDYIFFVSNDGDYVMKGSNDVAYLNGDSDIYGIGRTRLGSSNYSFVITGNIDDGWDASIVQTNTITLSEVVGDYEQNQTHIDLYEFEGVSLTATLDNVDYPVTYNQVIVPYEVTSERVYHADNTLSTVINLLPLIVVIGLFVILVGEFLYTRYL